jgi:hypothetical protein
MLPSYLCEVIFRGKRPKKRVLCAVKYNYTTHILYYAQLNNIDFQAKFKEGIRMKLPLVNMFVTCEYVTMGMGERPTVVDVFNNIHFPELPGSHKFTLFARLLAEPSIHPIHIKARRGDAKQDIDIFSTEISIGEAQAHNILITEDFTFDHPGQYTFSICTGDELLGNTYLTISNDPSPDQEEVPKDDMENE